MRGLSKPATAVGLMSLGAVLAYFLDPDRGRSRRARTADQAKAKARRSRQRADAQLRYAEGRLEGVAAKARGAGEMTPADDIDVVQGIKQHLSTLDLRTDGVVVDVNDGVAGLRGEVDDPDGLKKVEVEVSTVPGVQEVRSWLHLPGTPAPNKERALRAS